MSCRLPGAGDPESFWRLLRDGGDAVTGVPDGRWPASGGGPGQPGRRGGFLDDIEGFDAAFFGVSPRAAAASDPHQRLMLELAWEALEHARVVPAELRGAAAGVFVGAISSDFAALQDRLGTAGDGRHAYAGVSRSFIANRVSYFLGLSGPSLTVDTGQSSSLVAVQLACDSLSRGESELALAGGVNLNLLAETTGAIDGLGALSADGRCHVFDAAANGYVRGEGGGVVVLKPLHAALRDGDPVRCVILGGAVGGGAGDGLTVPSAAAQQRVLAAACARAGVDPAAVQYVELHGTGTRAGDPVEAAALGAVLGRGRPAGRPLLVGSVKTNIGHLEGAAGIAGLLKVALSIGHGELPPSLHFSTPNPDIDLAALRLRVVTGRSGWPGPDGPALAGVSSFGLGGTNCHLILGPPPAPAAPAGTSPAAAAPAGTSPAPAPASGSAAAAPAEPLPGSSLPWTLSARSRPALRAQARRLAEHLDQLGADGSQPAGPAAVARTLLQARTAFPHRAVILGPDPRAGLAALAGGQPADAVVTGETVTGRLAFVFPGQGSQWPGMARGLLAASPVFAGLIERCAAALAPFTGYSLTAVLRGEPGAPGLDRADVVQPALWATMVSLAGLWRASGVEPDVVIGHSQGEIAAATVAGALTLDDGARVVALRSRAIAALAGSGGMMSVAAPEPVVRAAMEACAAATPGPDGDGGQLSLAAVNGPRSVVVAGPVAALEAVAGRVTAAGYRAKIVPVDYASHSPAVEQVRDEVLAALAPVRPVRSDIEFVSALAGEAVDTTTLTADYWYASLRQPVQFGLAVRSALRAGCGLLVECSPHPVLIGAVEEAIEDGGQPAGVVGTLRRDAGGADQFRRSLAEAYVRGARVRWTAGPAEPRSALADLPSYAFTRRRYPLFPAVRPGAAGNSQPGGNGAGFSGPGNQAAEADLAGESPVADRDDQADRADQADQLSLTRAELGDLVRRVTADVLGFAGPGDIAPGQTFKDLGAGSADALELVRRLRAATGSPLPVSLVYDYPTPAQLAEHLLARPVPGLAGDAGPEQDGPGADGTADPTVDDPIAIVGIGCRYPGGVSSPEDLWELVAAGRDAITGFPRDRGWDLEALFSGDPSRRSITRQGGFLDDAAGFDAAFFGISPREAAATDPQQRLLLEVGWEALEYGGIDPHTLRGTRTGVFVGAMSADYGPRLHQPAPGADGHRLTGTASSVASGRIAYTFGLLGPALTVDTACSSSLVAMHLAVQALRRGECDLALAGGVTVLASPGIFVEFTRQRGLSADGRCKAFSAAADGTGWAEGAGLVVLERLSAARRLGHRVLALVRGSAVNSDGHSNGLTAPSGVAQQRVIADALADARLTTADVDAVEAHGTGTRLGDPVEANALIEAYGPGRPAGRPLWLGSVKSNIGHTQAAAGVAGVIKLVMAMRHGELPATLHAGEPTPHVDWSAGCVRLLTEPVPWPAGGKPAVAGISGFGISGTNAHLILSQPPSPESQFPFPPSQPPSPERKPGDAHPSRASAPAATAPAMTDPEPATTGLAAADAPLAWIVSARTASALRDQATRLRSFALAASAADLAAAGPALLRRARFAHRAVLLAGDRGELAAGLAALAAGQPHPCLSAGVAADDVRPVFVFPGQGSQWPGMAADLLDAQPAFRAELERCDAALAEHTGWSVADVLRGAPGAPELAGSDVIQPVLFAVMSSLAALWRAAGVQPAAVLGHSQGELTAAYAAGVLTLPDAARIMALRSRALMKLTGTGAMLAVQAPAAELSGLLGRWEGRLWLAITSGPAAVVVAGDPDALEEFAEACGDRWRVHRVAIDYAAHTPHMEILREELLAIAAGVVPQPTDVAFCSSLAGELADPASLTAEYWYRGLRHEVRFAQAVGSLTALGTPLLIEASPHPVLTGHAADVLRDRGAAGSATGTLRRNSDGPRQFLRAAAQAFVAGAEIDWAVLLSPPGNTATGNAARENTVAGNSAAEDSAGAGKQTALPGYPFERQRYWLTDEPAAGDSGAAGTPHPLVPTTLALADGGFLLAGRLSADRLGWLPDHAVAGTVLLPGTAFVELAGQAARQLAVQVEELIIEAPLTAGAGQAAQVQVRVTEPDVGGRRGLTVYARPDGDPAAPWTRHASGWLAQPGPDAAADTTNRLAAWPPDGAEPVDLSHAYPRLAARGYQYGPAFQGLVRAWRHGADGYAEVALPGPVRPEAGAYALHPALLDAALHYLVLQDTNEPDGGQGQLLPFAWNAVRVIRPGAAALRVHLSEGGDGRVSLACYDADGHLAARVGGLTLRAVPASPGTAAAGGRAEPGLRSAEWVEVDAAPVSPDGHRVAVIGADEQAEALAAELSAAGAEVAHYYDLASLADLADLGAGLLPDDILATCGDSTATGPAALREAAGTALDLIQGWVGDERFAGHRLVLVTSGAVETSLAAAAVWGLGRSAQREHPGRFALLDVTGQTPAAALTAALAAGLPQLALDGTGLRLPRLSQSGPGTSTGPRAGTAPGHAGAEGPALAGGTVLVTGATGGLGPLVAQRLAERHGVRHLLLASRRGPAAPGAAELTARLEALGAQVSLVACDVGDPAALAGLLAQVPPGRPLSGVVHAAGIVEDATVERLSARQLDAVLRGKADAAWQLSELTRDLPLAAFVLFSSVAGTAGSPGQGNYAAANAALDTLARRRHAAGLPATAIAWGPWDAGAGMTARLRDVDLARMADHGLLPLAAEDGLDLFDRALTAGEPVLLAAHWTADGPSRFRLDGTADLAAGHPDAAGLAAAGHPAESDLVPRGPAVTASLPGVAGQPAAVPGAAPAGGALPARLSAVPAAEGQQLLLDLVRVHAAAVLGYPSPDAIDVQRAVSELGFDSLTAVELRNQLDTATGLRLSATLAFDHPTVTALAEHLYRELVPAPPAPEETLRAVLDQVERSWPEPDDATRSKITAILHSALARWEPGPRDAPAVQEKISAASDDEIFALIDNEI